MEQPYGDQAVGKITLPNQIGIPRERVVEVGIAVFHFSPVLFAIRQYVLKVGPGIAVGECRPQIGTVGKPVIQLELGEQEPVHTAVGQRIEPYKPGAVGHDLKTLIIHAGVF